MTKTNTGVAFLERIKGDVAISRRILSVRPENLEECIEECLNMADDMFKKFYKEPLAARAFSYVYRYFRDLVDNFKKCSPENPYDFRLAELIKEYKIDKKILLDGSENRENPEPYIEIDDSKNPKLTPEKRCINDKKRIRGIYNLLRKEYESAGSDTNRFHELFRAYSSERRMVSKIKEIDVPEYPATKNELVDKFKRN